MVPFGKGTLFEVDATPDVEAPRSSRTSEHAQPPPMGSSQKSQRSIRPIMPRACDKREGTSPGGGRSGELRFFRCGGGGRELLAALPHFPKAAGRCGSHDLLMSGTSWAGAAVVRFRRSGGASGGLRHPRMMLLLLLPRRVSRSWWSLLE